MKPHVDCNQGSGYYRRLEPDRTSDQPVQRFSNKNHLGSLKEREQIHGPAPIDAFCESCPGDDDMAPDLGTMSWSHLYA